MRPVFNIFLLISVLIGQGVTVFSVNPTYTDSTAPVLIRWPTRTIKIAFSTSLNSPGPNIKIGSDVTGAARRALLRWSDVADVKFEVTESTAQSVSPTNSTDRINLVTVADTPQNNAMFASGNMAARTRVFYDKESGAISEADLIINAHPVSADGLPVQFSTDGTPGTLDLESTFTHEIGHLLGLEHSPVLAATMHEHQALNGLYNHHSFTERTLSEDDRSNVRRLYGSLEHGVIEGRIFKELPGGEKTAVSGLQLWLEESMSGRLIGNVVTGRDGSYRISNLAPRTYRLLAGQRVDKIAPQVQPSNNRIGQDHALPVTRYARIGTPIVLQSNDSQVVDLAIESVPRASRFLNPELVGANKELSSVSIPTDAGSALKIYVAGEGVDQLSGNGVTITSPFFSVAANSLKTEAYGSSFPVVSFQVKVAPNVPFGDYSIRLQSNSGEVAYLPGALTIDPGVESIQANPVDDARFYLRQEYRDFLGRDPDPEGLEYWAGQLDQCGKDIECIRNRKLNITSAFLGENEFQKKAAFVYELYRVGLGRRPLFTEFISDRDQLADLAKNDELKHSLTLALIQRSEFEQLFPATMSSQQFVDRLLNGILQNSGVNLSVLRDQLLALNDGSANGRANVLVRLAENEQVNTAEYDRLFVLMQYFGYLQRDPDETEYRSLVSSLDRKSPSLPAHYSPTICTFLTSNEYQSRFGMVMTHNKSECDRE